MTELRTNRLLLRQARHEDLGGVHAVYADPVAMAYWSSLPHSDVDQTAGLLWGMINAAPPITYFVVEHEGEAIGTAGFWQGDEVGYILHRDFWRQGLGTELLQALIHFGFDTLKLGQITADVDPRNAGSIHMLLRAGFKETGRAKNTLQVGDSWVDSVYFTLPRPTSV